MNVLHTQKGDVALRSIDRDLFEKIRQLLPYGVVGIKRPDSSDTEFGIVMQCDDQEVFGIKLQPADCDQELAAMRMQANTVLVATAITIYLKQGFGGIMLPLPYLRDKGDRFESGIAMFIFPQPGGPETMTDSPHAGAFDSTFGRGCTAMLEAFITALKQSAEQTGLTLYPVIGIEPRPRLELGALAFGCMVVGSELLAIKTTMNEKDFIWAILKDAGINSLVHMPSRPAVITQADLGIAKPDQQV